ncbi:AI-2E family transporter [Xylanimonas ulmi]|uniref:Putative PurR-regulated permease PerM n=1 Tax=Xylanimonas ulmi TaxID=228973 RepID=A0A4Q7M6X9_9MICO|nr:AI-2E family transporter [Xylanibacterium ulmi]RZS62837.1 putative PurR-regulated permease PerM [Xylanibacterium ulmi]
MKVVFEPGNIWRTGLVVLALIALAATVMAVLDAGGSLLFTVFTAWFVSLAMEPAVSRLARRMPRAAATGLVMLAVVLFLGTFFTLFGNLVVQQISSLVQGIPGLIDQALDWSYEQFGVRYSLEDLLAQVQANAGSAATFATQIAGGIVAVIGSIAGAVGTFFIFALMLFYLSADGPRLRRWMASLFPPRAQEATLVVWDTMADKTGRYVGARLLLATVNAFCSAIVFGVIGLPSWLALALWTGILAQFIPAIGTYISIALPVLVGLLSPNPWLGVIVLGWGVLYQQVENLTIEPRISSRAVNVHPAVSFGSVILGSSMFGIAGALLAVPVVAMLLSLLELYRTRYELVPALAADAAAPDPGATRTSDGARAARAGAAGAPGAGAASGAGASRDRAAGPAHDGTGRLDRPEGSPGPDAPGTEPGATTPREPGPTG